MPLAAEPFTFTWSLPALTCRHGVSPEEANFQDEFFQKVKETKTTLDRIYLSSLTRNREKAIIYDYEKWARKDGKPVEKKSEDVSQASASKHRQRPARGPVRPLGVDDRKIEAALQCGLWDDSRPRQKKKSLRMPHIMSRVQCYDFDDDYQGDVERSHQEGCTYSLDSSKVFRVIQEETRDQANRRLKKGKCGGWKPKKQARLVSPSMIDSVDESDDDYSSSVRVTIEEEHSKRRGGVVTKVTHRQKLGFSTIKKRGVMQSDTVEYRLPKLNSKPIITEIVAEEPKGEHDHTENVVKLPLLEGVKKKPLAEKPKKKVKHCKKLSRMKRKKKLEREKENDESSIGLITDDEVETELSIETSVLEEVSNKLSDISRGKGDDINSKTTKNKLVCKKAIDEDALSEYPFMAMGIDDLSSDEECLCDECLAEMSSSAKPKLDKKPIKSILSPRRRRRTTSSGSAKSVSFAETENLEDIRLISPLAVRNENMKKLDDEERRERLKQKDIKRRERRQRERERFAALYKKSMKKAEAQQKVKDIQEKIKDISKTMSTCPESKPPLTSISQDTITTSHDSIDDSENDASLSGEKEDHNDRDNDLLSLGDKMDGDSGFEDGTPRSPTPNSEVHEVEALLLDPQDGRLYEDVVLEKGNGKITVAQLGYRIKSIFDRDLPTPAPPKPPPTATTKSDVVDHEVEKSPAEDEDDEKDKAFVTKCVDWNETTESASTSRSATPVEKEDMSDFIMSMKNCRYIRWSKSYQDMLEKMEK
nr:uncharacterized protein LOC129281161 [Lytechinus pictus]